MKLEKGERIRAGIRERRGRREVAGIRERRGGQKEEVSTGSSLHALS